MNRALRNQHAKRCAFRKHGAGYGMGAPLVSMDAPFAVTVPVNQAFDDCVFPARPGQLIPIANPALAQVVMAGGGCGCTAFKRGGSRKGARKGSKKGTRKVGGSCGGGCGCTLMRGGAGGFAVDPAMSIGGNGPVALPAYVAVPCDPRAGSQTNVGIPDSRAPANLYSLTSNQPLSGGLSGGGVSGAPGSQIPVYNAEVAGFSFRPITNAGIVPFNEVVPQAARVGGRRRNSRKAKKSKKAKKTRKH